MTQPIPERLRITHAQWSETDCAHKVQIGDDSRTIAYVWVPGGIGDRQAANEAHDIAVRICEGWNA